MAIKTITMATLRAVAVMRLISIADTFTAHLVKLKLIPQSRDVDHWRKEIAAYLVQAQRLTYLKAGKRMKLKDLESSLFYIDIPRTIESVVLDVCEDYDIPRMATTQSVLDYAVRIYETLGPLILEDRIRTKDDWYKVVRELTK